MLIYDFSNIFLDFYVGLPLLCMRASSLCIDVSCDIKTSSSLTAVKLQISFHLGQDRSRYLEKQS